jgi:hypothetical protein
MVLEKDYINATKLSVAWAFTGIDWWRGPPNNRLQGSADTLDSHPRIYQNNDVGMFE